MLKEIEEQPKVCQDIIDKRIDSKKKQINFDTLSASFIQKLKKIQRIVFVSCGTAYHASLVARYMMEEVVSIPCEDNVSSEFRYYSDPMLGKNDLVVLISQSGETADTIAALKEAQRRGAQVLAICNVVGSTIAREADAVIYTHAGPEIGVASTKAYVAQLLTLALFTVFLGKLRGALSVKPFNHFLDQFKKIPQHVKTVLGQKDQVNLAAEALKTKKNFLYLARGYNFATALEGALKLKEISYIHAHGYAAGEMKHGPIALVDRKLPIVYITPHSKTYEKMISNIEELKAREGIIVSVATQGDEEVKKRSRFTFSIPKVDEFFSPILTVIPVQLLAYRVAVLNGCDVDQPKNLAKSVTVE
jgi:glucosamine--fructose-6-phosphate aminotransferase (isomerizing)